MRISDWSSDVCSSDLKMGLVVLPQALKVVIPPMVSLFIAAFKHTSLVVIIGIYDLMQSTKVSLTDPAWRGFSIEAYVFIARSEERRVGKEGVSSCRYRWPAAH